MRELELLQRRCDLMWTAIRSRALSSSSSSSVFQPWKQLGFSGLNRNFSLSSIDVNNDNNKGMLNLQEVEKVLNDVKADNVKVIPVRQHCDWMVIATGRSTWHVKNIAQALIYKAASLQLQGAVDWPFPLLGLAKQNQKGARRLLLPSVQGHETGKWVVIDSGTVIVHALDEKARAYYDLESLWTSEMPQNEPTQDLEKAFVKVRPKNNSKKPAQVQGGA